MAGVGPFFEQRREWARWKHALLERYLPKFVGILGSRYPVIYFVDGFAGAGSYESDHDGAGAVPGSPLLAAKVAADFAASGKWSFSLRCINVEHDAATFASLCASTADYAAPTVTNLRGTFRQHLDAILDQLGKAPALFFLDPFGFKGMEWDIVDRLAQRAKLAPTEVIVNFLVGEIDQAAGWVDSRRQKAAPAFQRRLDELFGTPAWRTIVESEGDPTERKRKLTRLYQEQLYGAFGFAARYGVRAIDGSLRYYLLYGTHHRRGAREMSDVVYRVEKAYSTAKRQVDDGRPRQLSLEDIGRTAPSPEDTRADLVRQISEDAYARGCRIGRIMFGELQNQLALRWFGRAVEPHYRDACKLLIRDGRIDRDSETGIVERTVLVFKES